MKTEKLRILKNPSFYIINSDRDSPLKTIFILQLFKKVAMNINPILVATFFGPLKILEDSSWWGSCGTPCLLFGTKRKSPQISETFLKIVVAVLLIDIIIIIIVQFRFASYLQGLHYN